MNINKIGINNLLNVILVNEDIRPACLIQPINYNETDANDPITNYILNEIKILFPNLKQSNNYKEYQGVIISKKEYDQRNDISNKKMGEILGYPCFKDFEKIKINSDFITYTIEIVVRLKKESFPIKILTNVCSDKTKIRMFKEIADKAKKVFDKEENKNMIKKINDSEIEDIEVIVNKEIPSQIIINKLTNNKKIEQPYKDRILNILYNLGFSIEFQFFFQDNFQYHNPTHRGLLLGLLLSDRNNLLEPFIPLQKYPQQDKKVEVIIENWGNDIMNIINKTKIKSKERITKKNH